MSAKDLELVEADGVLTIYDQPTYVNLRLADDYSDTGDQEAASSQHVLPLKKKVFTPQYAHAPTVVDELTKLKSERGRIVPVGKDIYVEDDPDVVDAMAQAFIHIDRVVQKTLIEVRIIECTPAFAERFGLTRPGGHFGGPLGEGTGPKLDESASEQSRARVFSDDAKVHTLVLSEAETLRLSAGLTAADRSGGGVRTISAPRIMAANDQEVNIRQGRSSCGYPSGVTASMVQFKEIVFEFKIKPHVEENSQSVFLYIEFTQPDAPGQPDDGIEPAVLTKAPLAELAIKDGETLVINGIYTEDQSGSELGAAAGRVVPLADWLGIIRRPSEDAPISEVIVLITAKIIPISI